ncbi:MAG: FAD:protein FMN transferase, partial [Pseudomonadota bacterium]|nr:FAD:protein FMN transferase [Pseudomonadota bacterium]
YHHIIDPKTGYPVSGVQSVTVIHTDAGVADAAATALFVAGVDHWPEVARAIGVRYVLLVDEAGRVHANPAMAARLLFDSGDQPAVIVSSPL